jgi:hypothetical protein
MWTQSTCSLWPMSCMPVLWSSGVWIHVMLLVVTSFANLGDPCFLVYRAEVILCRLYIVTFSIARPVKEYCLKIDTFPSSFLLCHHCTIFNLMLQHLSRWTVPLLEKLVENVSVHMVGIYSSIQTKAVDYVARNGTIAQNMLCDLTILFFRRNLALCNW